MMEEKIKIELTQEECEIFKWCWKNYKIWKQAIRLSPMKLILNLNSSAEVKPEFYLAGKQTVDKLGKINEMNGKTNIS